MAAKKPVSYEKAMERLEEITELLEGNEVPLNESLDLFEEGLELVKQCQKHLQTFDEKFQKLLKSHQVEEEDED